MLPLQRRPLETELPSPTDWSTPGTTDTTTSGGKRKRSRVVAGPTPARPRTPRRTTLSPVLTHHPLKQSRSVKSTETVCMSLAKVEGGLQVKYLLDTGASDNFLSRSLFNQLPRATRARLEAQQLTAATANGGDMLIYGSLSLSCRLRGAHLEYLVQSSQHNRGCYPGYGLLQREQVPARPRPGPTPHGGACVSMRRPYRVSPLC